jgi:hypothetical protein
MAGRLSLAKLVTPKTSADAGTDSPEEKLAETFFKIEFDFVGLGNEIHREYATTLSDWRQLVEHYVRLCLYFERSAINELTESISTQRHLRPSIDVAREIVTNGLAETISILKKPSDKEDYKDLFAHAAKQVWSVANQIRCLGEQLSSRG